MRFDVATMAAVRLTLAEELLQPASGVDGVFILNVTGSTDRGKYYRKDRNPCCYPAPQATFRRSHNRER
jgi:hypothetical protein